MKTLQECKDEVARGHCYSTWAELCKNGNHDGTPDDWFDEAAHLFASQFNNPPVYGQFVNPTEDEVMLFICDAYNVFVETRDKFKLMDFILDKTPHRIITRTQSDGLGDSSGSEKEAERRFPLHEQDSEIPCISINDIQREYRQVFQEGYNYAQSVKEVSREGEKEELDKLKDLLASDSVYWSLRNAYKSPSTLGDVEDDSYIDLYNLSNELRKTRKP